MIQIAQDISSDVQVKKRRRSGLRRGFLTCAAGEIDKPRCVSYFPTTPNLDKPEKYNTKICHLAQEIVPKCLSREMESCFFRKVKP